MKSKNNKLVQVLLDEDTHAKLIKLIGAEAVENGTKLDTISGWTRKLIKDTVNFEFNKKKIEDFSYRDQIKNIKKK